MTFEECRARLYERFPPGRTKLLVHPRYHFPPPVGSTTLEQVDFFLRSIGAPFEVARLEGKFIMLRPRA